MNNFFFLKCFQKWYSHLKHWKKIFSLLFSPRKLCLQNIIGTRADTINQGLCKTSSVLKWFTVGVMLSLCFYVSIPVKFFFFNEMWIPLIPMEFMFVDQSTLSGYITASVIQGVLGIFAGLATIMYGSGFLISVCNYNFHVHLIAQDFQDLDGMWNGSSQTTVAVRHAYLSNICWKLQDMERYNKNVLVKGCFWCF